MSLMLKLLITTSLLGTSLLANSLDNILLDYEENRLLQKRVKLNDINLGFKKSFANGWIGYAFNVNVNVQGKNIDVKDILFTDGKVIVSDIVDIKTKRSLKSKMYPTLSSKYYKKYNLIAGTHGAKNKIVIFSDPLCPFCINYVPKVIKHVNKYPKNIALYYYHFPLLRIHPAADVVTKAMEVAKKDVKDLTLKVYEANFEAKKLFNARETNKQKVLNGFNKVLGTSITMTQINDNKIAQHVKSDEKMGDDAMVQGTPTIFVNGEIDSEKFKYESLR